MLGAIDKIDKANQAGQFRRFTGNDYTTDLAKGNVYVSMAWSGDMVQLQSDNPDLRFTYFEEGNVAFNDNLMMPAHVEHPYAAETMFNYLYDPVVAAKLAAYVNYISPVKGAKEELEKTDPEHRQQRADLPAAGGPGQDPRLPEPLAGRRARDAGGDGEGDRRLVRCSACRCTGAGS